MPETFQIPPTPNMIDVAELIKTGRLLNTVIVDGNDGGEPVALVPNGFKLESLAGFYPPEFTKQGVFLNTADAFIDYVGKFRTAATVIFANVTDDGASFLAAIDYHGKDKPDRVAHRAQFTCKKTNEWQAWMSKNASDFTQEAFAVFLEENQRIFQAPSGAELLELVTTLEGKSHVDFTSAMRLNNGSNRLQFEENVEMRGGVGTGQIDIPQKFVLALAPFEGEAPYRVEARLKYRINSRKIAFRYETITPHLIVRDAARIIVERIKELTGVPLLMGSI